MKKILSLIIAVVALTVAIPTVVYSSAIVGNSKSMIYHRSDCRTIKHLSMEYWVDFSSQSEALSAGYRACKICIRG